jgi:phage host-nuclease inhibitor protein Gam
MINADKLVAAYIKMRDAKDALTREYEVKANEIKEQMEKVEEALLELCKANGQDGGKTAHGTFTRTVKTRYSTNNWDAMRRFIKEHDAIDLLEQRISQLKMKQFLSENPGLLPEGLNVDSRYAVVVRRKSA